MDRRQIFGNKIKDIRALRGLSISEVAAGTGLKEKSIKNIESGASSTDFDTIDKIAEFYGMEMEFTASNSQ